MQTQIQPQWQEINDTLIINDIENLGDEVKKIAVSYNYQPLVEWGQKLVDQAALFDIDALTGTLKQFPLILEQLENIISTKRDE